MKRFLLLSLIFCSMWVHAQSLPQVGEKSADDFLVRISQSGWRTEGASLSYDGQTLYLAIRKAPREVFDLYMSRKEKGRWQMPVLIEALSSDADEEDPTISSDEMTIYFVRHEKKDAGTKLETEEYNLYASVKQQDGSWQVPQQLVITNGKDHAPLILPDNLTFVFTSTRGTGKEAVTGRYMMRKMDKYNWTLPQAVEAGVDEKTLCQPVLTMQGQVMSDHQPIAANLDIYNTLTQRRITSLKTDEKGQYRVALPPYVRYMVDVNKEGLSHVYRWIDCTEQERDSLVEWNPVLSKALTIRLCTYDADNMARLAPELEVTDAETGRRLTSVVEKGKAGDYLLHLPIGKDYRLRQTLPAYADTIYHIDTRRDVRFADTELDMTMRVGRVATTFLVSDRETGEAVPAQMVLENLTIADDPETLSMQDGTAKENLRCGTRYSMQLSAPGYIFRDTTILMPSVEQDVTIAMTLEPLRQAVTVQLRNIQFEFNSYLLKDESYAELRKVAELMRQNPSLRIEISAHTDDIGSDQYNQRLSAKRAASAVDYLVKEEGVDKRRLEWKGYGKQRPLVPNDSDENRALNRRVEFSILEL